MGTGCAAERAVCKSLHRNSHSSYSFKFPGCIIIQGIVVFKNVYMCIACVEPDLGMEPGLAHHFFLQLLNGVVSTALSLYTLQPSPARMRSGGLLQSVCVCVCVCACVLPSICPPFFSVTAATPSVKRGHIIK